MKRALASSFRRYTLVAENMIAASTADARLVRHSTFIYSFSSPGKPARRGICFACNNFFLFKLSKAILGSTDIFHDFFHQMEGICVKVVNLNQIFRFLKGRCHGNQFGQNWRNDLHSTPWHFKTDWHVAIWINSFIAPMILLHRVQIW